MERAARLEVFFFHISLKFLIKTSLNKDIFPSLKGPRQEASLHAPQKRGPCGNRRPFPEPYLAYPSGFPLREPTLQVPLIELPRREMPHSSVYEPPSRLPLLRWLVFVDTCVCAQCLSAAVLELSFLLTEHEKCQLLIMLARAWNGSKWNRRQWNLKPLEISYHTIGGLCSCIVSTAVFFPWICLVVLWTGKETHEIRSNELLGKWNEFAAVGYVPFSC
jgi:hypothetical protein